MPRAISQADAPTQEDKDVQQPLMAMLGQGPSGDASKRGGRRSGRIRSGAAWPPLGVISLVAGLFIGAGLFAAYSYVLYVDDTTPGGLAADQQLSAAFGLTVYAGLTLAAVGIILSLAGLFQSYKSRWLGIPGLIVNLAVAGGVLSMMGVVELPIEQATERAQQLPGVDRLID